MIKRDNVILGIGIDIIEIKRIEAAISKNSDFLSRVFTADEIKYFESRNKRTEVLAGNFAAKEAVSKALAVGFRYFEWKDIEVLRDALGKPFVILHNNAKSMLSDNCMVHISISHCHEYAVANALIESWDDGRLHENRCIHTEDRGQILP